MTRLLAVLVGVLAAVAVGCQPPPPPPACTPAPLPVDTHLYGDSLTAMARAPICQRYTAAGVGLDIDGRAGTRAVDHITGISRVPAGRCVIVLLGTNDLTTGTVEQAEWNALAAINAAQATGARRVVWALLDERSAALRPPPALAETVEYNLWLIDLTAGGHYGDLLAIHDWRATAATLPDGYLMPDHLHHTPAGAEAYADTAAAAHAHC